MSIECHVSGRPMRILTFTFASLCIHLCLCLLNIPPIFGTCFENILKAYGSSCAGQWPPGLQGSENIHRMGTQWLQWWFLTYPGEAIWVVPNEAVHEVVCGHTKPKSHQSGRWWRDLENSPPPKTCTWVTVHRSVTSWWFQPILKVFVKLDHFPK